MNSSKINLGALVLPLLFAFGNHANAGNVGELITFNAGTPAVAADVNGNFNEVRDQVNDNFARINANSAEISGNSDAIQAIGGAGAVSVSSLAMTSATPKNCVIAKLFNPGGGAAYAYFETTSTQYNCQMSAGIQLPDKATITGLSCALFDLDGTEYWPIVRLVRQSNDASHADIVASSPALFDSTSVQVVHADFVYYPAVDNGQYSYSLVLTSNGVNAMTASSKLRLYSCAVNYTFNE
jgi:hypothetical protein